MQCVDLAVIVLNISQKSTFLSENWKNSDTQWLFDDNNRLFLGVIMALGLC